MFAYLDSRIFIHKNLIVGAVLLILVLGGLIVAAKPGPAAKAPPRVELQSQSDLTAEQMSFDFGTVSMAAGKVTHLFPIRNANAAPIVIRKISTSCMCTTAQLVKGGKKLAIYGMPGHGYVPNLDEPLAAQEQAMVEVVFDPAAHGPAGIGRVERYVTIYTGAAQPLELSFNALVTP
ncbi:MAG: DUF1573 domain-containing protein [Burkholderiales bacterium]|nr:DUF1573 domain-containing protein [Burkholderiales bacterium]